MGEKYQGKVPCRLSCHLHMKNLLKRSTKRKSTAPIAELPEVHVDDLELTFHLGFRIPKILADLRDQMDFTNGLKTEGIFRISGVETEIVELYDQLNNGGNVRHFDSHNAANLMKRWFKAWDVRLLHNVPLSDFEKEPLLDITTYLSGSYLSVWQWLLQLLVDTYAYRDHNKMSAKNIAIVWAPALMPEAASGSQLNDTLTMTQYATSLLTHLIENNGHIYIPKETKFTADSKTDEAEPSSHKLSSHSRCKSIDIKGEMDPSSFLSMEILCQVF